MNARFSRLIKIFVLALCACSPWAARAASPADEAAIRAVLSATWDKPEQRLSVAPIVVLGGHAIAGWTQGERGGRALLARSSSGKWEVTACGGDGLKEAKNLTLAGIPAATADGLAKALRQAEAKEPADRLARFSTFDALVRMDATGHDGHTASGTKQ